MRFGKPVRIRPLPDAEVVATIDHGSSASDHALGNHTYHHVDVTRLSAARFDAELALADRAIRRISGTRSPWLRPPYRAFDARTRSRAARLGYRIMLWDVDSEDWRRPGTSSIVSNVLSCIPAGRRRPHARRRRRPRADGCGARPDPGQSQRAWVHGPGASSPGFFLIADNAPSIFALRRRLSEDSSSYTTAVMVH